MMTFFWRLVILDLIQDLLWHEERSYGVVFILNQ